MKQKTNARPRSSQRQVAEPTAVYIKRPKSIPIDTIICGDALEVLKTFPSESVSLIVTSPPYADRRLRTYGGITPENYVSCPSLIDWERLTRFNSEAEHGS